MVTKSQLIQTFAEAIATMEGFYLRKPTPTWAQRNNNPGNLRSWGRVPVVGGYASFSTPTDGWAALRVQIEKNLFKRKLTIAEFFNGKPGVYAGYAPAADSNDPLHYAEFVRRRLMKAHPSLRDLLTRSGVNTLLCQIPYQAE